MHRDELASCLIVMALTLPAMTSAADAEPPPSQQTRLNDELDEVLVEGRRIRQKNPQQSFNWLARLVGEFTIGGYVDPAPGNGLEHRLGVRGQAICVGFGMAPGVQCELRALWSEATGPDGEEIPGGVSRFDPAVLLFGFNLAGEASEENYTLQHIMVDNTGLAESGVGYRVGNDTMLSRSACAVLPDCERVMRITVNPDLDTVEMRIELEVRRETTLRYNFVMTRVPDSKAVVYGRKPAREKKKK